ncbi:MAG TPA: CHRD domain-containing protein [Nocardioidaceae bacterium]|nr:CHRD domain-containing protein [Nocardioidaceae bacterium]
MRAQHKRPAIATGIAVLAAAGLLTFASGAVAGHTNAVLEADLDGRTEVGQTPAIVGDPDGRGDVYVFGIDGDPTTLCYVLTVDKIGPATAAHIHRADAGANGPVVVNLAAPGDGNSADCLTESETGKFVGDQTVEEILEHPDHFYVNVHNAEYPGGALRGQLAAER